METHGFFNEEILRENKITTVVMTGVEFLKNVADDYQFTLSPTQHITGNRGAYYPHPSGDIIFVSKEVFDCITDEDTKEIAFENLNIVVCIYEKDLLPPAGLNTKFDKKKYHILNKK